MRSAAIASRDGIDLAAVAARMRALAEAAAGEHLERTAWRPAPAGSAPRRVHAAHRDQAHRLRLLAQGEEGCA